MLFNYVLYENILGGYLQSTAVYSGYFPLDIPRRAFSLLFDSTSVWLTDDSALVDKFPWIVLSSIGMVVAIFRGHILLKVLAAALIWQFCLYAAYGDLSVISMWRWLNVHYFKWMLPYFSLFAWLTVRWAATSFFQKRPYEGAMKIAAVALAAAAVLGIQFRVNTFDVDSTVNSDQRTTLVLISRGQRVDFLDVRGMSGDFSQLYEGTHAVDVNGTPLKQGRDFRLISAPWGARLLFNRTVRLRTIFFVPDARVQIQVSAIAVTGSSVRLGFGLPQWDRDASPAKWPAVAAKQAIRPFESRRM